MKFNKLIIMALPLLIATPLSTVASNIFTGQEIVLAAQSHNGKGTITKIDVKGKRIELKHGPIKSMGWSGMTMFFDLDDEDMLDEIKQGDIVDFEFIKTRDNRYVITDIENDG